MARAASQATFFKRTFDKYWIQLVFPRDVPKTRQMWKRNRQPWRKPTRVTVGTHRAVIASPTHFVGSTIVQKLRPCFAVGWNFPWWLLAQCGCVVGQHAIKFSNTFLAAHLSLFVRVRVSRAPVARRQAFVGGICSDIAHQTKRAASVLCVVSRLTINARSGQVFIAALPP